MRESIITLVLGNNDVGPGSEQSISFDKKYAFGGRLGNRPILILPKTIALKCSHSRYL